MFHPTSNSTSVGITNNMDVYTFALLTSIYIIYFILHMCVNIV